MAEDIIEAIDEVNRLRRSKEYKKPRGIGASDRFRKEYVDGPLEWATIHRAWSNGLSGVMVAIRNHPLVHWVNFYPSSPEAEGKVKTEEHPFKIEVCHGAGFGSCLDCQPHEGQMIELKPQFKEALKRAGYDLKYNIDISGPTFDEMLEGNRRLHVPRDIRGNPRGEYRIMHRGIHVGTISVSYPHKRVEANYFLGLSSNAKHVKPLVKILFDGKLLRKEMTARFTVIEDKRLPERRLTSGTPKLLPAGRKRQ